MIHKMSAASYGWLQQKIDEMNLRAKRLGVETVRAEVIGRRVVETETSIRTVLTVEVEGGYPHLAGWRFVATIEPTPAGNVIKAIPGETYPERYREAGNGCDHCQVERHRNQTFIIAHEDGRWAQVGRNCLADYIGSSLSPEALANRAQFLAEVRDLGGEERDERGSRFEQHLDLADFLAHVASISRVFGYVTRKAAFPGSGLQTTADRTWGVMVSRLDAEYAEKQGWTGPTADDIRVAKAAIAAGRARTGSSDFDHNLRTVANLDAIPRRQAGIAAYLIEAYNRDRERVLAARVTAKAPRALAPVAVGEVGTRGTFLDLYVAAVHDFESDYGGSWTLVRFLDRDGNTLIWRTASEVEWLRQAREDGDMVSIVGTVKEHGDFHGTPQTVLSRVAPVMPTGSENGGGGVAHPPQEGIEA